jgi:hypothetical protein
MLGHIFQPPVHPPHPAGFGEVHVVGVGFPEPLFSRFACNRLRRWPVLKRRPTGGPSIRTWTRWRLPHWPKAQSAGPTNPARPAGGRRRFALRMPG